MKKTKILLAYLLIGSISILFSKDINIQTAEKIALNFMFDRINTFERDISFYELNILSSHLVDNAYYVFNFNEGWVLVSANDVMVPVLGYNYNGSFPAKDQQSDNFKSWMQHYVDQLQFIKEKNIESEDHKTEWEKYLTDNPHLLLNNKNLDEVEPLLTCTWHQNYPYNIYCPEDPAGPGGYTYVGCVATAMVQIMLYWRYPTLGYGSLTYYCYPYGDITVYFEYFSYEWDAMQDDIDYNNPWEIAQISYHAAVSLYMNFGPNGSGTSIIKVTNALKTYFNYDTSAALFEREYFDLLDWEDLIREELDLLRPLDYGGHSSNGGHNFVCDGYQEDPNYFHFNFGWSGNSNGYYTLDNLNGFNSNQRIVKNIFPADPDYPYIAEGTDILTYLSGSFTEGSGPSEDYPSGMEASWLIAPQSETDSVSNITLTFIQFNTALTDYLKIYDGETMADELIGEFSGDELPADISSTGNKMLVTFSSSETGKGFRIEYNPSYPDYCQNQQTFTEPTGTITDGSGAFNYCNSTACVYTIECPSAIKYNLEFTSFSTEASEDIVCIYDGDDNLIGEYSGSGMPEYLEIETNKVYITWSTNEIFTEAGWSFDYTVDFTGISEKMPESSLSIVPNPFSKSSILEYELQQASFVQLSIYSQFGEKVKAIDMEYQAKGIHQIFINGSELSAGVYFCLLKTSKGKQTLKIIKL